ncbi:glycoside hydrolase family 38 C-terminal domain-containing protein [Nonomuraea harbinensis]|uniref:Glycoside hydrolase family 38 C-terminal domain-containing protein n=1 Tax=Nonomuraea harbinensis TaxID=1286938 RepID=A0ABW1BSB8_9ACTN|nr:glycoside hydrolase family 38 C-terminal domain-containing protein [Nonomuraea harbinensis]
MSVRLLSAEPTDLFVGPADRPRQVLKVTVARDGREAALEVRGDGVRGHATVPAGDGPVTLEVPLDAETPPGAVVPCVVTLEGETLDVTVTAESPGWTMFMVSHFHYDPVWWNTQAAYTSPWELLAADATTRPLWEFNAFALVEAHIELALRDPDYRFVLAEVDYLKPFLDTHPERRADLRALLAEGRAELVGGTYNEPNTNLTGAETTIRNLVHGIGYQRDILGGDPRTAWQLDAFGHDPQFPGYLAAAGLTGSAWARGPFHQWGPIDKNFGAAGNDATLMQFPSEFEWIAPSGLGVLTHYMPAHYSAGWWMDSAPTLEAAMAAVYELYRSLKPVAATRNILLPVGTDYTPPNKWVTEIHRAWNARYVWPRFVCGTPRDFLDAVRTEISALSPQSRDMNPIYTGKDVSYIDTKQAQRAAEVAALDAERLSALAALLGLGRYPHTALDKVWRQLAYGAHHDAITGSESDQVYIDLLTGWREAYDLAADARDRALDALMGQVAVDGRSVVVTNTLPFARDGLVRVRLGPGLRVADPAGVEIPAVSEHGTLTFTARDVPATGWRTYRIVEGRADPWQDLPGTTIENERWRIVADPARGGALASVTDLATGRELLTGLGNELRLYEEYPQHPDMGEGPWHLMPTGSSLGSGDAPADSVRAETSPVGQRIIVTGQVGEVAYEQVVTLLAGSHRVDLTTRVVDYTGADRLLRVRFPAHVEGALPVSDVAGAVVGRGFALPDVDSAEHPWTLDNPANTWFGLSSTARVDLGPAGARAIGVAEIVVPGPSDAPRARELVAALARVGVTATTSTASGTRYGWLHVDSNLPDTRIVLGGPDTNPVAAELLSRCDPVFSEALTSGAPRVWVPAERPLAEVWRPSADLRDLRSLPALIVAGPVDELVDELVDDLAGAVIPALCPAGSERLDDRTVALLAYGLPGFAVDPSGALHLSLMRSCTGWPSGVWLDPPRRTGPDGSAFQLQHWTHEFSYALVAGPGDWRANRLPSSGQEFTTPLLPRVVTPANRPPTHTTNPASEPPHATDRLLMGATGPAGVAPHAGASPPRATARSLTGATGLVLPQVCSLLRVEPARDVLLGTLKATGNPHAHGRARHDAETVTLRLVEATGLGSEAKVHSPLLPSALTPADLLERPLPPTAPHPAAGGFDGSVLPKRVRGSRTRRPLFDPEGNHPGAVWLGGAEVGTFLVAAEPMETGPELGAVRETAQPVYARYWLHNKGPAPLGYLPVSVTLTPGLVTPDGPFELDVVVSSQLTDAAHEGVVELHVPDGWTVLPARRPFRVEPGGHVRLPATVTPAPGRGLHFVSARTGVGGQVIEDVVTVALGDAPELPVPGPAPAPVDAVRGTTADEARPTGLSVTTLADALTLRPGDRAALTVRLANGTHGEIRGEAQLAAPWGTWELLPSVIRGFTVAAGGTCDVTFPVEVPPDATAGHFWALPKVMWFGRCQYAATVRLEVTR